MRASRRRESNLQSVGWGWLPQAFPPACSLCNTHCNSAHWHLLGGAWEGHGVHTGSQGMIPAPHHSCLVFRFCSSSPGNTQTSTISSTSPGLQSNGFSQPHFVLTGLKGVTFPQAVPPFCLLPREKRGKMQRKDFFFSSGDEAKGTGINPSRSQKLLTWKEKPKTARSWRKTGIEIPWGSNPWVVRRDTEIFH